VCVNTNCANELKDLNDTEYVTSIYNEYKDCVYIHPEKICADCRDALANITDDEFYPSLACAECFNECGHTYRP